MLPHLNNVNHFSRLEALQISLIQQFLSTKRREHCIGILSTTGRANRIVNSEFINTLTNSKENSTLHRIDALNGQCHFSIQVIQPTTPKTHLQPQVYFTVILITTPKEGRNNERKEVWKDGRKECCREQRSIEGSVGSGKEG